MWSVLMNGSKLIYKAKVKGGVFFLHVFQSTTKMCPKAAARLVYLAALNAVIK